MGVLDATQPMEEGLYLLIRGVPHSKRLHSLYATPAIILRSRESGDCSIHRRLAVVLDKLISDVYFWKGIGLGALRISGWRLDVSK